ncbi:MAG: HAMP domain-containing histidine kinase [Gammaproteobacteria bacterium]|nr:HAMP domain-containing histidine kinase [Gammaproteobacteria bacterium]
MPSSRGLKQRISRALLLQAGAIAIAAVVGVYFAGVVLKDVLITQALRQEAEFFWERLAADPAFPLPDTRNLTGFMAGRDHMRQPNETMSAMQPGFHDLPGSIDFGTVYVTENDGTRLYLVFDGEQVDVLAAYFGLVPLTVVLLVLYLSVWLIYRASQRAVSPITRLAREVNNLDPEAPDPELFKQPRSLTNADEEVRVLSAALAQFAERLNAFVERERNFTRDASHELRSPLTVIRLASDTLLSQHDLPAESHETAERIKRSVIEMEELVQAFLLLARESEAGLYKKDVCVNDVVGEELQRACVLAADRPIDVENVADCLLYTVASDKALSILFGNLIRNAFSYTDAGRIAAHISRDSVVIEDSGVGMEPDQVRTLLKPFHRADPTRDGGFGVGLTIVMRLSDRFGWPVQIDSKPGAGTRVTVRFPEARYVETN